MKHVYWRPQKISRRLLFSVALLSLGGLVVVETFQTTRRQPNYDVKLSAAQLAHDAMTVIKQERIRRGHQFSDRFDPGKTGWVGEAMTPVTSLPASLVAKQTSVNPNFAAVIVDMLTQAGIQRGDCVAVGYSGSYPALNVCLCAALETLELKPIVIASAASSQFGANDPQLLWIDMERILFEHGQISFRSTAASIGGYGDRGKGMSDQARNLFVAAIKRNNLSLIQQETLSESIEERMRIYRDQSHEKPIKAYVNVGGGAASIRGSTGKRLYRVGLNISAPPGFAQADSVMSRFARQGIPVINLVRAEELAARFGLPEAPAVMPAVGTGAVFVQTTHRRWLAAVVLLGILGTLRAFVLTDLGHRIKAFLRRGIWSTWQADSETLVDTTTGPQLMV